MNILTDILPTEFSVDGYKIKINYDFRTMIQIDLLFKDNSIDMHEKWEKAFNLFYKEIPFLQIKIPPCWVQSGVGRKIIPLSNKGIAQIPLKF